MAVWQYGDRAKCFSADMASEADRGMPEVLCRFRTPFNTAAWIAALAEKSARPEEEEKTKKNKAGRTIRLRSFDIAFFAPAGFRKPQPLFRRRMLSGWRGP